MTLAFDSKTEFYKATRSKVWRPKSNPLVSTQEQVSTASTGYCNNGVFPEELIERLRPLYDEGETREPLMSAFKASLLKFDCDPFTGQQVAHPRVARQRNQIRIPQVSKEMIAPFVPTGATAGYHYEEIMAFRCAMEVSTHCPDHEISIYRVEPSVRSQVVDSYPFEPGEVVYLSAEKAEVLAEFDRYRKAPRNVYVASTSVPVKELFWSGGGCLTFRWDPRS